jgi:hypothetical protein
MNEEYIPVENESFDARLDQVTIVGDIEKIPQRREERATVHAEHVKDDGSVFGVQVGERFVHMQGESAVSSLISHLTQWGGVPHSDATERRLFT